MAVDNATAQRSQGLSQAHQQELLKGGGIGGLVGMFLGSPVLGALAGAAWKLFTNQDMAKGMQQVIGQVSQSAGIDLDSIKQNLGNTLAGKVDGETKPDETVARQNANNPEFKIPGWLKALGVGVLGVGLFRNLFNPLMGMGGMGGMGAMGAMGAMGGMPYGGMPWGGMQGMMPYGNPLFSGAGMFPFFGGFNF